MFKVLSIDGGGMRGVIPSVLLRHIENETGKPIAEMFDLIVGTSTGGIIAAALTVKNNSQTPKYSSEDVLNIYKNKGKEIFNRSLWRRFTSVGGATDERYDYKPFEAILHDYLGDNSLEDCIRPIVITSYDIQRRCPYFFKTSKAQNDSDRNHYLKDAVRATSAAPTYFEPAPVDSLAPTNPTRRFLIDGGVFVNNPAMCAYVEAISAGASPDNILLLSLGTGATNREIPYQDAKNWGDLGWCRPISGVMMDGQSDATDYHLKHILPGTDARKRQRYFRFDIKLEEVMDDIDDATAGNILNLERKAQQIIDRDQRELRRLVKKLT